MGVEGVRGSERALATLYNSAVAAWALAAAWEIGALEELHRERRLDVRAFAIRENLDESSTVGLFRALAVAGIVRREGTVVTPRERFEEAYRTKSFFHWLTRGSAELFREIPSVLPRANRTGDFYRRDPAAIAYACREIDEVTYAPTFRKALREIDFTPRRVADLGCGSGARLRQILELYPSATGIGIDVADPALEVARAELEAAELGHRAGFVHGDVLRLSPAPEYDSVDLLTCFMMGHDFWQDRGREGAIATLRGLREAFPGARRLLIGDATRTTFADDELPVFTLGFELGHDLMGTYLPSIAEWESVIPESGWELVGMHRIEMTVGEVILVLG
ncbi:methyltransferase domain-containing protein [Streptomyces sp. ST2-7A]|nr:class I SAM-dependent methyltransferase [Streptomyces sp. ST2-7A]MCE7079475.1 methyltransferase domain-containing protein [Streptomyces sp. ST2-7A]